MRFDRPGNPAHSSPASITAMAEKDLRKLRMVTGHPRLYPSWVDTLYAPVLLSEAIVTPQESQ